MFQHDFCVSDFLDRWAVQSFCIFLVSFGKEELSIYQENRIQLAVIAWEGSLEKHCRYASLKINVVVHCSRIDWYFQTYMQKARWHLLMCRLDNGNLFHMYLVSLNSILISFLIIRNRISWSKCTFYAVFNAAKNPLWAAFASNCIQWWFIDSIKPNTADNTAVRLISKEGVWNCF